jgi:uncharacterized protein YraI
VPTGVTPPSPTAPNNAPPANNTPAPAPTGSDSAKPKAIVNTPLVNLRDGPSTDDNIITLVERGQEFEIIGKNAAGDWWNICCFEGQAAWITNEFVDTDGAVDQVPVVTDVALVQTPTPMPPTSAPVDAPAQPTPTPQPQGEVAIASTPSLAFDLIVQEQFPEPNVVRIFLYVYDDKSALEGYTLRITKDSAELPVNVTSFGPNPGFTWPVADPRQRWQNFKIEFPGVLPAGAWEVQLMQNGAPAGPPATFTLQANDPQQELYVRYERRQSQ